MGSGLLLCIYYIGGGSAMIFEFSDIYNEKIMESSVLFITGKHNVFNNLVADRIRDRYCKIERSNLIAMPDYLKELTAGFDVAKTQDTDELRVSTELFDDYIALTNIPNIGGKRISIVYYTDLTKKQREKLETHIKKPSPYGMLVVIMTEFGDFKKMLRSKGIYNSSKVHLLKLSFPRKNILRDVVTEQLGSIRIASSAVELFIIKLSDQYDMYPEALELLKDSGLTTITPDDIKSILKDIDNFVLDDFIDKLLNPHRVKMIVPKKGKPREAKPRKIYKIYDSLISELGARGLVNKLKYKLEALIEMRVIINKGLAPVGLKFPVGSVRESLPDDSKVKLLSNYAFIRLHTQASYTSMQDMLFLRMMLNNIRLSPWTEEPYERILFTLINRAILGNDRILNDVGILDTFESNLVNVNKALIPDEDISSGMLI